MGEVDPFNERPWPHQIGLRQQIATLLRMERIRGGDSTCDILWTQMLGQQMFQFKIHNPAIYMM
jgi:hypothetical protein